MKNAFKVFGIISIALIIGFSCSNGTTDKDPVNGIWSAGDESITLNNGNFVIAQDGKQVVKGTYTTTPRSISAKITLTIKELHGDYLTKEMDVEGLTFGSKWYNKKQVEADLTKDGYSVNPELLDEMFPTMEGTIDDDSMTIDGDTYTRPPTTKPAPSTGGSTGSLTGGTTSTGGDTLTLTGQVYVLDYSSSNYIAAYKGSDINSFTNDAGGTGSIKNGKLSFTIGVPTLKMEPATKLPSMEDYNWDIYKDIKVTPSDAKGSGLGSFTGEAEGLVKCNLGNITSTSAITTEYVFYVYVDKACTITATGGTDKKSGMTFGNLNLKHNKGWNAMNVKVTINSNNNTGTINISMGDLTTCNWMLLGASYLGY